MSAARRKSPLEIVVLYDYGYVNGGAAKVAIAGAVGLAEMRGHRVSYLAPVGPLDPRLAAAGVEAATLGQPDLLSAPSAVRAAARGLWNRRAGQAVARLLAGRDPARTVVLQHGWSKALSPAAERAVARSGLASVYYMHEYFAACPNGAFFDYQDGCNCPLRPMSAACVAKHCDARAYGHKLFRVARHAALLGPGQFRRNLHHAVYISELQRRVMAPWLPPGTPLTYAPNPVEVDDAGPAEIADDAPFLFVGRFSREKGAELAARAAAAAGAPIAFVGDGELAPALRRLAPEAEFTGWLPPAEVTARMRRARALVFPSLWHECQPLAVLEALACGIPVIVADACAGAEFVDDGETGLHVRARDVGALAEAMRRLAPARARSFGRAAHARYWARPHTLPRHLDALESALHAALAGNRPLEGAAIKL